MFDDLFQIVALLAVIGTSIFRFIKARKVKKVREQLAVVASRINASVDPGQRSISGKIEDIPFKVKYEPALEKTPARIDVVLNKALPFKLNIAATLFLNIAPKTTSEFTSISRSKVNDSFAWRWSQRATVAKPECVKISGQKTRSGRCGKGHKKPKGKKTAEGPGHWSTGRGN